MTIGELSRVLAPLHRRIMLAIGRGIVRTVDDGAAMQRLQVSALADETHAAVDRLQPFGLTGHPLPGAEVVLIAVAGNRDHPVAVQVDDPRLRPTGLQPGEVCIYAARSGQRITLKADGTVLIQAPVKLRIEAPVTEVIGDVTVTGDVTAGSVSLRNHVHTGVVTGGALTGAPQP